MKYFRIDVQIVAMKVVFILQARSPFFLDVAPRDWVNVF
jgi:hypothetical protein